ncbi:hypothetical protein D3C85_816580 [compost metagenome]
MASTTRLATFAPNAVDIIITQASTGYSHTIGQYSEDSIVMVDRNAETFTLYTGADNTNTRIYNANTSGTITVSLQQTSASNDALMALYEQDRVSRSGLFSILVKDNSGRSSYFCEEAYVGVVPNSAYNNSMQTRDWVIHAPQLETFIGGNSILSSEDAAGLQLLGVTVADRWL